MKVLSRFDVTMTLQFFEELGIYPKNRDGYLYPNSEQASSIVAVLMMECERLKVQFHYNESVKEIRKPHYTVVTEAMILKEDKNGDRKKKSAVTSEIKQYTYHTGKIILATGGCASPKLGSDGSGYMLAKVLGHSITKPLPALVQLKSPDKYCKTVSGVRTNAIVTVFVENQRIIKEEGEILFTDYGISGIPIMQVSRFAAKALDKGSKVHLLLDFLPEITKNDLLQLLNNRKKQQPHKNLEEMMVGLLNNKLSYIILLEAKLDPYKSTRALSEKELNQLVNLLKEFKMMINDTNSFDNAQVCTGGVPTSEIDRDTMESKYSKGLYLVGELVDVDGTCGGYNLQWAWSTGYLAGMACALG